MSDEERIFRRGYDAAITMVEDQIIRLLLNAEKAPDSAEPVGHLLELFGRVTGTTHNSPEYERRLQAARTRGAMAGGETRVDE